MDDAHRLRERFLLRVKRELTAHIPTPEAARSSGYVLGGEATIRDCEHVHSHLDDMAGVLAEHLASEVERLAAILVPEEFRRAALDVRDARDLLINGWPFPAWWPREALAGHEWFNNLEHLPWGGIVWHPSVAPADVAKWLRERAGNHPGAIEVADHLERGYNPGQAIGLEGNETDKPWTGLRWTAAGVSLLFAAYSEAKASQRVGTIRHGVTREGRAALELFTVGGGASIDAAGKPWNASAGTGWAEVVWNSRPKPMQLTLTGFSDEPTWRTVAGILDELKHDGLRDWLILHRMAQQQGASGTIRWAWADHKREATYQRRIKQGVSEDDLAKEVMDRIVRMKNAELKLCEPTPDGRGVVWRRIGPFGLLDIPTGVDAFTRAGRTTRMALIKLNPEIYKGAARDTPRPHFMLVADAVLRMPGPRLALLAMLFCDFQYARDPNGVRRDLGTLLFYGTLRDGSYTPRKHLAAAQRTLEGHLDALVKEGHLDRYTREQDGGQVSYQIRPPRWWIDRALLGVPPSYGPSLAAVPRTGRELRDWRTRSGRSQLEVATALGVSARTIIRAEKRPADALTAKLLAALADAATPRLPPASG